MKNFAVSFVLRKQLLDNQENIGNLLRIIKATNSQEAVGIMHEVLQDTDYSDHHLMFYTCICINEVEAIELAKDEGDK